MQKKQAREPKKRPTPSRTKRKREQSPQEQEREQAPLSSFEESTQTETSRPQHFEEPTQIEMPHPQHFEESTQTEMPHPQHTQPPRLNPASTAGSCTEMVDYTYPFIGANAYQDLCDVVFDPRKPLNLRSPSLVFLGDQHYKAFGAIVDRLEHEVVLISSGPVTTARGIPYTSSAAERSERPFYTKILDSEKVIAWYGVNVHLLHPKVKPLPLGSKWKWIVGPLGNVGPLVKILASLASDPRANFLMDRPNLLLVKMSDFTADHPNFAPSRGHRRKAITASKFATKLPKSVRSLESDRPRTCPHANANFKALEEYLWTMRQYKFVLSPVGVGLACHRTWEAMLMGAIPIVESFSTMDPLYEGLPVLIVQNWSVLSETFLNEAYATMRTKQYQWEKLFMPYYEDKINKDLWTRSNRQQLTLT